MARKPEIGNIKLYPLRPLRKSDTAGFVIQFYCPIQKRRIRRSCGTRDRREARRVLRECRERLLNGKYVQSHGAITEQHEAKMPIPIYVRDIEANRDSMTWDEAFDQYRSFKRSRLRKPSFQSLCSRLEMSQRIFEARRANDGLPPGTTIRECMALSSLQYLQERLLDGDEGRHESRLPSTVNSVVGDVMAFVRYCFKHEWIGKVPELDDLDEDEPMRGRPITGEEFDRMIACTPRIVGESAAASWQFLLQVLWESGFRVSDVLNFYWHDETKIHPIWATRKRGHSTIVIPSTQKNRKTDEIPMLPGLRQLLERVPSQNRVGVVVKLKPIEYSIPTQKPGAFSPTPEDLAKLIVDYSNCAIGAACKVSETTVRSWLRRLGLERHDRIRRYGEEIPSTVIEGMKQSRQRQRSRSRSLSKDRVSRIISAIGEEAGVIVRQADDERGVRVKYASAHDLRRSLAERLFNRGISAETLMVIMRHRDFATTRKFYAAKRRAESAAAEIQSVLGADDANGELESIRKDCTEEPQLSRGGSVIELGYWVRGCEPS